MAELRKVASGFAKQCLWLRNIKVGSQVSGIDQNRLSGDEQLGKLGEPATERRREYTRNASFTSFTCLSYACRNSYKI